MPYRIIETDTSGGSYWSEKFLDLPPIKLRKKALKIAELINDSCCRKPAPDNPNPDRRYWKVESTNYQPKTGIKSPHE